ncbi:MAG: hypothetical protein GY757_02535, partial [bacterium]|nr:hypothetical protein [bacterium]
MRKKTGCLLIGHNNMEVKQYEKSIRKMGEKSGAYRDLNLNILHVKNTPYHLSGLFNMLYCNGEWPGQDKKKVDMFDTFSATLAYLGTYLHKHGITFDYVHSFQEEKETLARKLQEDEIQTIAVTTTYYVAAQPILEIMEFIKKYNKKAKIIVGGPFISTKIRCLQDPMLVDYLLDKTIGADYYVNSSQGEATLVRLIEALQKDQSVEDIENI